MSVRILEGTYDGRKPGAVLICGTTGTAFGPLFNDYQEADGFLIFAREHGYRELRGERPDILADLARRFRAEREADHA